MAGPYAVAAIAKSVGGEKVAVDWLRENDQSPEAFTPNAERRARVQAAEIIVTTGDLLWMLPPGAKSEQTLIRLESLLAAPPPPTTEPADVDPVISSHSIGYVWLDPSFARRLAAQLARTLSRIEPNWREVLDENVTQFEQSIDAAVASSVEPPTTRPGQPFLSVDPGFAPLASAFGFEPIELPGGRSIELPVSDSNRRWILAVARDRGVSVLFVPVETQSGLILDLKAAVGEALRIETLDAFGSSAGSGRNTYEEVLRYNLEQLSKARQ